MEQHQPVSATYLGTVKVSRGRTGSHVYPTLRLPESLGYTIGTRVGVYVVGNHLVLSPDKYKDNDKNAEAYEPKKQSATRLYTAGTESSNRLEPIC